MRYMVVVKDENSLEKIIKGLKHLDKTIELTGRRGTYTTKKEKHPMFEVSSDRSNLQYDAYNAKNPDAMYEGPRVENFLRDLVLIQEGALGNAEIQWMAAFGQGLIYNKPTLSEYFRQARESIKSLSAQKQITPEDLQKATETIKINPFEPDFTKRVINNLTEEEFENLIKTLENVRVEVDKKIDKEWAKSKSLPKPWENSEFFDTLSPYEQSYYLFFLARHVENQEFVYDMREARQDGRTLILIRPKNNPNYKGSLEQIVAALFKHQEITTHQSVAVVQNLEDARLMMKGISIQKVNFTDDDFEEAQNQISDFIETKKDSKEIQEIIANMLTKQK